VYLLEPNFDVGIKGDQITFSQAMEVMIIENGSMQ